MKRPLEEVERDFDLLINPTPIEFEGAGLVLARKARRDSSHPVPSVSYVLVNPDSKMQMTISIASLGLLSISIQNDQKGLYFLDGYLEKYKRFDEIKWLFEGMSDLPGIMSYLRNLVGTEMKDIFQGKRWVDIKFDWTSYV